MKRVALVLTIIFSLLLGINLYGAGGRLPIPPCAYTGDSYCEPASGAWTDWNQNKTRDSTPASVTFTLRSAGIYDANFKDGVVAGTFSKVSDAASTPGQVATIPIGSNFGSGQMEISVDTTGAGGTYYLQVSALVPSTARNVIWVRLDSPFTQIPPSNADAYVLYDGNVENSYGVFTRVKVADSSKPLNQVSAAGAIKEWTLSSAKHKFYILALPELKLECATISTDINTLGACPSTAPQSPNYTIKKFSAAPTTCTDFYDAEAVVFSGADSGVAASAVMKVGWYTNNKIYFCADVTDPYVSAASMAANDEAYFFNDDGILFLWKKGNQLLRDCDADTIQAGGNAAATPYTYDANRPSGCSTIATSYNAGVSCTKTATGGGYQLFCSMNAGFTITDNALTLCDAYLGDKLASGYTRKLGFSTAINAPAGWGICQFSSTEIVPPPDTTPPTISSVVEGTPTQTSETITNVTDENAQCWVQYDTAAISSSSPHTSLTPISTSHSHSITGLSAGTTYNYKVQCWDTSQNLTTTTNDTFATAAAENVLYIARSDASPAGNDTNWTTYHCTQH